MELNSETEWIVISEAGDAGVNRWNVQSRSECPDPQHANAVQSTHLDFSGQHTLPALDVPNCR